MTVLQNINKVLLNENSVL